MGTTEVLELAEVCVAPAVPVAIVGFLATVAEAIVEG